MLVVFTCVYWCTMRFLYQMMLMSVYQEHDGCHYRNRTWCPFWRTWVHPDVEWFCLVIVLYVLRFTASDYPFVIFKWLAISLPVLRFTTFEYPFDILKRLAIVLCVVRFTASDYSFGIFSFYLSSLCVVYISQFMWYSKACGSYQDFLDRGLLLTRKLLNQGFLLV
jgi:hypothetical protein